jgi:hypothetical protein
MGEPTRSIFDRDGRQSSSYRPYQSLAHTCASFTHEVLYLAESFPTFMCVVQAHILDDARGAGDGSRRLAVRWL